MDRRLEKRPDGGREEECAAADLLNLRSDGDGAGAAPTAVGGGSRRRRRRRLLPSHCVPAGVRGRGGRAGAAAVWRLRAELRLNSSGKRNENEGGVRRKKEGRRERTTEEEEGHKGDPPTRHTLTSHDNGMTGWVGMSGITKILHQLEDLGGNANLGICLTSPPDKISVVKSHGMSL